MSDEPAIDPATQQPPSADADASAGDPPLKDKPPRPRSTSGHGGRRAGAGRPKGAKSKSAATKRPAASSKGKTDAQLRKAVAAMLAIPVIPSVALPLGPDTKQFMVGHFMTAAPGSADQLVELSKQSTELREILEKLTTGSVTMGLLAIALGYAAPPALWLAGKRGAAEALGMLSTIDVDDPGRLMEMFGGDGPGIFGGDGAQAQGTPPVQSAAETAAQAAIDAARQAQAQTQYPPV